MEELIGIENKIIIINNYEMKKLIILFFVTVFTTQLFAQGTLNISSGATLKPTGGAYLVLNNTDLVNNGSLQQSPGDGYVAFAGNTDNVISGTGTTLFDNLILTKSSTANLDLQSNIAVITQINFTGGLLNVGNNNIDLGAMGVLNNESETSRAYSTGTTGYIQSIGLLNAPSATNLGNLGAIITSTSNMGFTTVQRTFNTYTALSNGNILRNYIITPTNDAGLNATFRFSYFDAELNGADETTLDMASSPDNGTTWSDIGFTTRDAVNNYIEKTGINAFSTWTLTPPSTVLAAAMGPLNASKANNSIDVSWQVYAEINVATYDVQRSADGENFKTIGVLDAVNASNYNYADNNPIDGYNYYRLLIVDKDGSIKYSNIDKVNIADATAADISFYPNPVVDHTVTLQLTNIPIGSYQLSVFDNAGKQVYASIINYAGGSSVQTVYLPQNISSGIYKVQLKNEKTIFNESLLVK